MKNEPEVSFLNAKMPLGSRPAKHRMHVAHEKNSEHAISCMLIGDGAVGKTSMITSYISNGYPNGYQQTAFDVFTGKCSKTKTQSDDQSGGNFNA